MNNSEALLKALFVQQRLQLIQIKLDHPHLIPNSYIFAWIEGVYPIFHDGDYSVPDKPHENFTSHFITSKSFAWDVIKHLDELWLSDKCPTFYELEDSFGGREVRSELIAICRYAYLDGKFDNKLWSALLAKMSHPSEAGFITDSFQDNELYIF
ncbi:TPA: hypothetical protein ACMDO2_004476 [Vibrio parahaemolyticus]|uniref:hypothetical protein n=1 Tax=Vibrio parahaemolyticus TaxID=670 RepID=UPI00164FF111|nr:hypothetical protein [Vibrio parahaemolyticus]EID4334154.1 hypothetical protein [Vibrio parahaemolyticus]